MYNSIQILKVHFVKKQTNKKTHKADADHVAADLILNQHFVQMLHNIGAMLIWVNSVPRYLCISLLLQAACLPSVQFLFN